MTSTPLLAFVLAVIASFVAQEGPRCVKCKSTGRIACSEHPKAECPLEDSVTYCTEVADCAVCGGVGFTDCARCENESVETEIQSRRERIASRPAGLRWVQEKWDESRSNPTAPLRIVETRNFILVWEMEAMKVGRKRLSQHQMAHLYADRLETLFRDYVENFQAKEREWSKQSLVMIWYLPNDQAEASLRFCQNGSRAGVKLLGSDPRYSVCANRQFFPGDEELHRNVVHNVAHLLLSHQRPSMWIGDKKYGWADEGVAHWFEELYFGRCTNYCYQEQNTNVDFKSGKYRLAVRKMVASGEAPPVAAVFQRTVDELTLPEHAVSFSYVDYLLHLDGAKFNTLMKRLRSKIVTREALMEVYDMNPLAFEAAWKAWVLETYPTR